MDILAQLKQDCRLSRGSKILKKLPSQEEVPSKMAGRSRIIVALLALIWIIPRPGRSLAQPPHVVEGWPLLELDLVRPNFWLGNEPVLGRLICPPLSRINLLKGGKSEGLIFESVRESPLEKNRWIWNYHLRSGIFWWNGEGVRALHVKNFLELNLGDVVKEKSGGIWQLPQFEVQAKGKSLRVLWAQKPAFGPYILNGVSLWRNKWENSNSLKCGESGSRCSDFRYECAGVYRAIAHQDHLLLNPSPGYGINGRNLIFRTGLPAPSATKRIEATMRFVTADSFSGDVELRPPDKPASCPNPIELPLVSVIDWNMAKYPVDSQEFRSILTNLIPRGSLLRSGAGHLGSLLSFVVPRNHPGYDDHSLVRPFNLEAGSRKLDSLGFIRPRGDFARQDPRGGVLQINLLLSRAEIGIVEKVIADSFMSVGILTHFLKPSQLKENQGTHGSVVGLHLPWPGMDLLPSFHSRVKPNFLVPTQYAGNLDSELEQYSLSLTYENPDFSVLKKIHSRMYSLEPMTVLMQHKACLEFENKSATAKVNVRDPDWFRKIVL